MVVSLVHSVIHHLNICLIPIFCYPSMYTTGTFIDSFGNWNIVSVVEYLWLFVFGFHEFNIIYLFHFEVYPVVVSNVVNVGVLLFAMVVVVSLSPHPNTYQRPNTLRLFVILIVINVSWYTSFYCSFFYFECNELLPYGDIIIYGSILILIVICVVLVIIIVVSISKSKSNNR